MLAAQHAAECLANGNGMWHSRAPDAREAFILSPTFLKDPSGRRFDQSHWWWGVCDSYDRNKPPALRPAMQYHWAPEGRGCHALRHDQPRLPSVDELAASFCRQHANTSILFVGDSIQGQLFTTFAHLMGYVEVVEGFSNPCYAFKYPKGAHEVDVTARLCGGSVTARFLRNEVLLLKACRENDSPAGCSATGPRRRDAPTSSCSPTRTRWLIILPQSTRKWNSTRTRRSSRYWRVCLGYWALQMMSQQRGGYAGLAWCSAACTRPSIIARKRYHGGT